MNNVSRSVAKSLIVVSTFIGVFAGVESAQAYPAGQNLSVLVSARSVSRAGDVLTVSAKNAQPGCTINFYWLGQTTAPTTSAIANSAGLTQQLRLATPAIAAKYNLRASLVSCPANTGATSSTVAITVGRITKITCTETASNYSARTSPVLRHDCFLKWGSLPVTAHNLKVGLSDKNGVRLSWNVFTTDSSGAIHVVYRNKVGVAGTYGFDTYYGPEKTYIANSLETSISIGR